MWVRTWVGRCGRTNKGQEDTGGWAQGGCRWVQGWHRVGAGGRRVGAGLAQGGRRVGIPSCSSDLGTPGVVVEVGQGEHHRAECLGAASCGHSAWRGQQPGTAALSVAGAKAGPPVKGK